MNVIIMGNYDMFTKKISPGAGTFAMSLSKELSKLVHIDFFTYSSLLNGTIKSFFSNKNFKKYDIVHDFIGWSYYRKTKSMPPFVVTLHDFTVNMFCPDFIFGPNYIGGVKGYFWFNLLRSRIIDNLKKADAIIAISNLSRELAIDLFDIDERKIFVINHGVTYSKNKNSAKIFDENKFIISTLSDLGPRKNPKMLLRAFKIFRDNLPDKERQNVELHLFGKASKKIIKWLNIQNYGENIFLDGPIDQTLKWSVYRESSIFAFPSIEEGFGMPIIEAQRYGIPTIIFGSGMISEEVGKYAYKAYTSEEMAKMFLKIYKYGFSKYHKINQLRYTKSFTWKKAAIETLKVYKRVLNDTK